MTNRNLLIETFSLHLYVNTRQVGYTDHTNSKIKSKGTINRHNSQIKGKVTVHNSKKIIKSCIFPHIICDGQQFNSLIRIG